MRYFPTSVPFRLSRWCSLLLVLPLLATPVLSQDREKEDKAGNPEQVQKESTQKEQAQKEQPKKQELNLDLLVFDVVPLSLTPADADTPPPTDRPPYQANELVTPPHDNPKPVAVAVEEQLQKNLPPATVTAEPGDIARREARLKELEQSGDAYANELTEVLMDLADDYESTGDLLKARGLYERANHVTRVNHGLFSIEQVPIVKRLFNNYLMSGDMVAADQQQEYLYYLNRKVHGPDNAELIPPLKEYAEWNVQAFLSYLPPALPVTPPADADADATPAPAPIATEVPDIVTFRIQHLLNAQMLYQQLIDLLRATTHRADPRLPEAERSLAVTSYLFATQAVFMDTSLLDTAAVGLYSETPRRPGFADGRHSLERRIQYLQENPTTAPADLARARLELADWMIATHTRSDFETVFETAYKDYAASGATQDEIDAIFHPPLPIEVPTFLIRSHSRLSLGIPVEASLQYRGYIDVEFGVSRIGDSVSPKILYRSPETPEAIEDIVVRSLRRAEFRPRMKDGELINNDKITARYYFTY